MERRLLRPLLRGEAVRAWRADADESAILWTHDTSDAPMKQLPPGASGWLTPWRRKLESRADAHGAPRWWTLFRTDAARSLSPSGAMAAVGPSLTMLSDIASSPGMAAAKPPYGRARTFRPGGDRPRTW